jgi:hypothetical protein
MSARKDFSPLPGFPIETKFTSLAAISEYLHGEKITCLLCGRSYKSINFHVSKHGMSADEYKEKYGLPYRTGLTSSGTKAKNRANGYKNSEQLVVMRTMIDREKQIAATKNQRTSDAKRCFCKLNGKKATGTPPKFTVDHGIVILKHMVDFDVSLADAVRSTGIMSMSGFWGLLKRHANEFAAEYENARMNVTKGSTNPMIRRQDVIDDIRGMRKSGIDRTTIAEKYGVHVEYVTILERGYERRYRK